MNPHLRPTAAIAADALLPGDPGRALALAQALLDEPKMSNHHRGLWGYSGVTAGGRELTIQSTGIGGPSAAIVLGELARHGVKRAIRLGTCTALPGGPAPGTAILVESAIAGEGSSRTLGAGDLTRPDRDLEAALRAEAAGSAVAKAVASLDVVSAVPGLEPAEPGRDGAEAVEMGTATLFELGPRVGVAVASALVVADRRPGPELLADAELEAVSAELAAAAARALAR